MAGLFSGEIDYTTVVIAMKDEKTGVGIQDNYGSYYLISYPKTFSGRNAVQFLARYKDISRQEAIELGNEMIKKHYFHQAGQGKGKINILHDDHNHFYRFLDDEKIENCLNSHRFLLSSPPPPSLLLPEIMAAMSGMVEEVVSEDGCIDYLKIRNCRSFYHFVDVVPHLQRCDISPLSEQEKTAFFLNLCNGMFLQACVSLYEYKPPGSRYSYLSMIKAVKYLINGYQFSLFDIIEGILRANGKRYFRSHFKKNDPRLSLCLENRDPRIHFALIYGCVSSPPLRVYRPETIEEDLDEATRFYLQKTTHAVPQQGEIQLTPLIEWSESDFGKNVWEIAAFLCRYLYDDKAFKVRTIRTTGTFNISYLNFDWTTNQTGHTSAYQFDLTSLSDFFSRFFGKENESSANTISPSLSSSPSPSPSSTLPSPSPSLSPSSSSSPSPSSSPSSSSSSSSPSPPSSSPSPSPSPSPSSPTP